jgi:hypothetical protein
LTLERRKLHRWQPGRLCSAAIIPVLLKKDMAMAVDNNSPLSADLISRHSVAEPTARTEQIQETGAATIEPGANPDGSGPPAERAVPIWPRVYPGL